MLSNQAQCALQQLYYKARKTRDNFDLERIDRALDEIIRLNSSEPAPFQTRSALAHATAVVRHRRELAPTNPLDGLLPNQEPGRIDDSFPIVELTLWLQTTPTLSTEQRQTLFRLINDPDPVELSATWNIPIPRARERISRIRKYARHAYLQEMSA
ncbi:hypothetical protein [Nocardia brasiliensis]|uniref:hypothetical protein n=1 Tax=Nocardia brasiliensis TaxID=37326 RepID=UPI001893EB76|nr:hypothetical protein [Nocardia brasiliensis]MBF6547612.1 hypothetical protein [Nocardia brasiliensis]